MFGFGGGVTFDPSKDIPDLGGKVVLVTGGNSGLGAETIKHVAQHNPSEIWLAARTRTTAESTLNAVKAIAPDATINLLDLDLGDLSSVKSAAETFTKQSKRLDVLFLNAGIAFATPGLTKSGYELQFGTNHMGHALLTKLLLPTLLRTADETPNSDVRVVVLSSAAHKSFGKNGIDFDGLKSPDQPTSTSARYGASKLANLLFSNSLAAKYPTIKTVSVHPGVVETPVFRSVDSSTSILGKTMAFLGHLVAAKVEVGVLNQLWAAFGKSENVTSGEYYEPVGKTGGRSNLAADKKLEEKLWDWTEAELAEKGWAGWPA